MRWPARFLAAPAALLLLATAGCGDPIQRYCGQLRDDRVRIAAMLDSASPTALVDNLSMLKDLAGSAPNDLTDEWQTFVNAVEGLSEALHEAGIKASDYRDGKPPAGLDPSARRAIADAATRLASPPVVQAVDGIDQEARDVCQIDLGVG
jgi:hypothetical protein